MFGQRPFVAIVAALLAGVAVPTGCGGDDDTVDASQVEQQIEQKVTIATSKVASVSCPDDVKSETGATFNCTAKLEDGGSAKIEVVETEAPDKFTYTVKPGTVELAGKSVEQAVGDDLAAQGVEDATVQCPDPVEVKPGTTVTCSVSGARDVGSVSFDFTNATGTIDESSVTTSP